MQGITLNSMDTSNYNQYIYTGFPKNTNTYIEMQRDISNICSTKRMEELKKDMTTIKKSAPGPDGITYEMTLKCWESISTPLRHVFMDCLALGAIPIIWLKSYAIFLPKPGKGTHNNPNDFRTINLSSCLLKIFERLLLWHIEIDANLNNYLHPLQFGFRKGSSCDLALSHLTSKIETTLSKKEIALGIFIDIN